MEAIVELIAALVGALVEAVIGLLEAAVALLAFVVEFLFLALTQGMSAALRRYRLRRQERVNRISVRKRVAESQNSDRGASISRKQSAILASIVIFAVICFVGAWAVRDRIRKQRVEETRSQVKTLVDTFAEQLEDDGAADPEPGKLNDRDAWQQPIELFVDHALFGSLVVVRSSGPDRKSGSIDDILATRVIRASAKDVGGELANRGMRAVRGRIAELLPGGDGEQLAEDVEVGKD